MDKILIIRNAYQFDFGGGERFPVFLARELTKLGYSPIVISRHKMLLQFAQNQSIPVIHGWWWNRQSWSGWRVVLVPIYFLWQTVLSLWYLRLFIALKPALIHVQSKDDFIAATLAAHVLNIKVVWTDHADLKHVWLNLTTVFKNPIGKFVHCAAKKTAAITVVSGSELQLVSSHLSHNDPIFSKLQVVYNGVVDTPLKVNNSYTFFTYCCASRLVRDKGIYELIRAFEDLYAEIPDIQLLLLGDGPERREITQTIRLDAVKVLGHQEEPLGVIAASDVFVHPTYHEGFSVALVEAAMLARPIIASSVGGNVEIIEDEVTGLLVPSKDISALKNAMKRLYEDAQLRTSLSHNARQQYEQRFNFATIVKDDFVRIYYEACGRDSNEV